MITVEVIGQDGRGLANATVQISWNNWTHSRGITNSLGRTSWNVSGGGGTIYVNNRVVYQGNINGTIRVRA